jgi:hypothetical protein
MANTTKQVRQGDLFLITVKEALDLSKFKKQPKSDRIVLLEGEATGHVHSVSGSQAELYEADGLMTALFKKQVKVTDENIQLVGVLKTEANTLTHQEHGAIEIDPGIHWVVRQREYSPAAIVHVMD